MYTVYGIPNCDSVKKTLTLAKEKSVEVVLHNYKTNGIDKVKLKAWIKAFGAEKVLNKQGTTYKKLTEEEKQLLTSNTSIIQFLLENTSAIKRPIVEKNNIPIAIGFSEEIFS